MSEHSRRAFLTRSARLLAAGTVAGSVPGVFGCDVAGTNGRRVAPLEPSRGLELMPGGDDDSDALEALLLAAVGVPEEPVVLRYAQGRPYHITRQIRIPEGVRLEGERFAGAFPRIHASHGGQITLGNHSSCEGLHLVGPGPNSVDRQEDVQPGFNSGGHVDIADGTVIRWTEGWTLRHCRIEGFSGAGINTGMAVRHVRVDGVECVGNGNAGIQVGLLSEAVEILGGRYVRNGTNGIDVNGTQCLIEDNDASDNGWNHFWDAGAVRASDRNGILVYISPFRGTARTVRLEAEGNVVRNNRCLRNERAGIMAVGTSAGTDLGAVQRNVHIEGNIASRNFAGVMIEGAGYGELRHAIVRGNELTANGNDLHGRPRGWGFLGLGLRYPSTRLENNVFSGNWTAPWLYEADQVTRVGNVVLRKGGRPPAPRTIGSSNPTTLG